ncbi:MAG: glycosyltransferase family 39 protein, partial [Arenimonas sp.]|nr:glycosyltransferase family 39 protein [Arenimonas sp.]
RGLIEPDEGRYTNVALQILQHNDWISLYRNQDSLHFTKPPLTYWLIATSVSLFGYNEWAVRLPMALSLILCVILTYQMGKVFVPKKPWLPALFLLGSPVVFFAANWVSTDSVLTAMLTLAMFCFVQSRFNQGHARWLDAMWLAFGLAFLTKGPPALLPLLVIVVFELWHKNAKSMFRPWGILAFIVVGLTWYVLVIQRHPGLLDYFLGHEVYARIATSAHSRNSEWYGALKIYGPVLFVGLLPWLVVWANQARLKTRSTETMPQEQKRFLWLWFLLPLLVFSLSQSRMYLYILGLFVPACLILAQRLQDWRIGFGAKLGLAIWFACLLALKGLMPILIDNHSKDSRVFADEIKPMLPGHPNQIIFVEDMSRNGLNLYFQTNIKKVSFIKQPKPISDSANDSSLAEELAKQPDHRIFIMKRENEQAFLDELTRHNQQAHKLGEWIESDAKSQRDRMIYTLANEFN